METRLPEVHWKQAGDPTGLTDAEIEWERIRLTAESPNAILAQLTFISLPPECGV